jgi:hypothetical protein
MMLICLDQNAIYQKDVRERQRFRARWELSQRKGEEPQVPIRQRRSVQL